MKNNPPHRHLPGRRRQAVVAVAIVGLVAVALALWRHGRGADHAAPPAPPPSCVGVRIEPGADLQAEVDANPPGTRFCLAEGVYRNLSVAPKSGDVISGAGQGRTVLDGANLIVHFETSGPLWYADNQVQENPRVGQCADTTLLCTNAEVLYVDGRPYRGVAATGAVTRGTFYFDYRAHRVYIADDPAGHTVEVGATNRAIGSDRPRNGLPGGATDVTVENLTVEKYAQSAQHGAIETGDGWLVKNVTSRINGGVGVVMFGNGSRLDHCRLLDNGEMGIAANTGDGQDGYHHALYPVYVSNSEIAGNNLNGYDLQWEGGGAKFWQTKDSIISHNYVHANIGGAALWDDGWNDNITYVGNRIEGSSTGISHEIGSSALIKGNMIDTPMSSSPSPESCHAAICIASSDGIQSDTSNRTIEVQGNYISTGRFGIVVAKTHPDFAVDHVEVHDNVISRAVEAVGWSADNQNLSSFHFDSNHYAKGEKFIFSYAVHSWTEWRQYGADLHGDMKADAHGPLKAAGIVAVVRG